MRPHERAHVSAEDVLKPVQNAVSGRGATRRSPPTKDESEGVVLTRATEAPWRNKRKCPPITSQGMSASSDSKGSRATASLPKHCFGCHPGCSDATASWAAVEIDHLICLPELSLSGENMAVLIFRLRNSATSFLPVAYTPKEMVPAPMTVFNGVSLFSVFF